MKKIIFLSILCIISLIINKSAFAENNFKKVYFAGGCFWCMEESFDKVDGVTLKNFDTKESSNYEADELLFLFGLNKKLGPILEWELELEAKKISVNTEDFQTNRDGIFAVGDINDYPGKLDLILCGFHETTLAVQKAYQRIFPGERVPFGYTTSNTKLQKKLGVAE